MADLLVSLGYHCETASSVEEALEYLPEANYSAIVLDMELGNRSGLEVATAARGFQSEHCVLIAVTAHGELLKQPGMEVFDARLSKPVDLNAVVAALNIKRPALPAA
jgi:CheY-like chemotaxis protein